MIRKIPLQLAILGLFVLILAGMISAFADANTVPQTRLASRSAPITANDLKPAECAAFDLTSIWICNKNNCQPTGTDVLVLGSDTTNKIDGKFVVGNSCCVGASGTTIVNCTWNN